TPPRTSTWRWSGRTTRSPSSPASCAGADVAPDARRRAAAEELVAYGRRMNPDGLAVGPAGNLSVRRDGVVAITPSQVRYDEITPEQICFVRLDGEHVGGEGRLSSETPMHLSVYRSTTAAAVVHTHSPRAVAASTVID